MNWPDWSENAFCLIPNILGIDGPKISPSKIQVLYPSLALSTASKELTNDFPTPPLPETIPITFLTSLYLFVFIMKG